MSADVFLDTNILIYAIEVDGPAPEKSAVAKGLVRRTDYSVSTQVLGEFYRAVTSARRSVPLSHEDATAWVQLWKRNPVHSITVAHVDLAIELRKRFDIQYFDALIISAARIAGCSKLFSEDLNPGQNDGGVTVSNPFKS